MLIEVDEFIEHAYNKFDELKQKWIDNADWEKYADRNLYEVKYGKDISILLSDRNMYSASILRHVDANKCLFSRLFRKIPASSKIQNFTAYYYDNGKLIMSEFKIDAYTKQITYYFDNEKNENVQIAFFVMPNEMGKNKMYFNSLEHSIYDINNRLISCENYINKSKQPYGISIYGEYYQYTDSRLTKAVKYDDYNRNFKMYPVMKELCPTIIINPHVYEYDFEYVESSVFCQRVHKHSLNETKIDRYELKNSELIKLSEKGLDCFGVL